MHSGILSHCPNYISIDSNIINNNKKKSEYNYNFFIALLLFSDLSIELDTGWKMGKQSAQQTDHSVIVVD